MNMNPLLRKIEELLVHDNRPTHELIDYIIDKKVNYILDSFILGRYENLKNGFVDKDGHWNHQVAKFNDTYSSDFIKRNNEVCAVEEVKFATSIIDCVKTCQYIEQSVARYEPYFTIANMAYLNKIKEHSLERIDNLKNHPEKIKLLNKSMSFIMSLAINITPEMQNKIILERHLEHKENNGPTIEPKKIKV
jgi:hypothetical protein